jgi:hypothetical protein
MWNNTEVSEKRSNAILRLDVFVTLMMEADFSLETSMLVLDGVETQ